MECDVRIVACGMTRRVECGVWSVESGICNAQCGLWTEDAGCGVWSAACGVRNVECGMWSVESGV
eukprot:10080213-Karenia_brevis.AAC.1